MIREIPVEEFHDRMKRIQKELVKRNLDALITFGNEAEPQNVRYLCDYWPAFETAGVIVPKEGEAILCIGPESLTYAKGRSKIKKIRQLLEYRESSEPEYPGVKLTTFKELFKEVSHGKGIRRLGMAGWAITSIPVYEGIKYALGKGELVKADDIIIEMRKIKSPNEIAMIKEAFKASQAGMEAVLNEIRPGMTESEVVGVAQGAMYSAGAEYEGHPQYVLSGEHSNHAIGRASHRKLKKGEIIQLDIGARVGGYSSSIGRPIYFGKIPRNIRRLFEIGLRSEEIVMESIKEGIVAKEVARIYTDFIKKNGFGNWLLYGPCHGLGLMECEHPWIESNSEFVLKENMTFEVDAFLHNQRMGTRWEDGIRVTCKGVEVLSKIKREIIEL